MYYAIQTSHTPKRTSWCSSTAATQDTNPAPDLDDETTPVEELPAASIHNGSHHEGDPSAVRLNMGAPADYPYPYLQVIAVT